MSLTVENSPLARFSPWRVLIFRSPRYYIYSYVYSSLFCFIYHNWRILTAHSRIHSHTFNANAGRKHEGGAQIRQPLVFSHIQFVFTLPWPDLQSG